MNIFAIFREWWTGRTDSERRILRQYHAMKQAQIRAASR